MRAAGVRMAYGTDLLGSMHRRQSEEFTIRAQVLPAQEIIASATSVAADVLGMAGKLGVIAPGAHADLIVVDGDPLADMTDIRRVRQVVLAGSVVGDPLGQT